MSSKYDIFGGKPFSSEGRPNVAALVQLMKNPKGSPASHGQNILSAYESTQRADGKQKSYTNGVLTGAWKRVVNHFFVPKTTKTVGDDGVTSIKSVKVYHYRNRKGVSQSLNSIAYFKARHPKLYNRYMKFFPVLKQGGVVFSVDGQLGFVQRSKFNRYSDSEKAHILGFLSFAHYSDKGDPRSAAALRTNRDSARYGGDRRGVLTALAQARKLYKAGKLNVASLPKVSANGVSTQDVVDGSRFKVSYKGLSAAEKKTRENEVKAMKSALVDLLVKNPNLVAAIRQQSEARKQATQAKRDAAKGSRLQAAIRFVEANLTSAALNASSLAGNDTIFNNPNALSYSQKTQIRKLANAIKLRAAARNGKVVKGTKLSGTVAAAIAATKRGGSHARYAFDDDETEDDFIGGGAGFGFDDDSFDDDSYIGGGRNNKANKDKKDNYIWFV